VLGNPGYYNYNHFMAVWIMSVITRVSQYQKVHFVFFLIFWCKMKITQADASTIWIDCHPIQTNWCPHLYHPQPPQFILAWDRHQI